MIEAGAFGLLGRPGQSVVNRSKDRGAKVCSTAGNGIALIAAAMTHLFAPDVAGQSFIIRLYQVYHNCSPPQPPTPTRPEWP